MSEIFSRFSFEKDDEEALKFLDAFIEHGAFLFYPFQFTKKYGADNLQISTSYDR